MEWSEGYDAACNGLDLVDNPYPKGSYAYHDWNEGYYARIYEVKEI